MFEAATAGLEFKKEIIKLGVRDLPVFLFVTLYFTSVSRCWFVRCKVVTLLNLTASGPPSRPCSSAVGLGEASVFLGRHGITSESAGRNHPLPAP